MHKSIIFIGRKGQSLRSITEKAKQYGLASIPFAEKKHMQWFLRYHFI